MSIYYPYTVLVNGDKSTLTDSKGKKKDIYLYMGDKNIDYYFTVKEASFNFRKNEGTNIIEQTSPSHAAVSLLKPDGTFVCSNKQAISKDQIKFTITEDMIDEITEVGDHIIVISLLDEENDSIATLPPIEGQMHIMERVTPLPGVDITTNVVNEAVVSLAQTTTENEVLNVFDDNGNYIKTVWSNGDRITQERLNKVEEGIYNNSSQLNNIANELGKNEDDSFKTLETDDKTIIGAINEVFQSASSGKSLIANAITGKGVATSNTDSFAQMANNISAIQGSGTGTTGDIQNTLNRCGAKKMRFGVLSDIHLKGDVTNTIDVNFANALAKFEELGCNFATICGDLCNYDKTTEYPAYTSIISNCSIPIYEVTGNHDTGSGTLTEDDWITLTGNGFHFEIINNDEVFIFISQRKYEDYSNSDNNKMLTQADKDWISSKLEEHKTKSRVFLFMHQYLGGLDGFSRIDSGSESYIKYDLDFWTNVASTYKNVIWFSGHSHTPFSYQANYPNVLAYNKNGEYCTMIHVPSLMASNEYYIVDVYEHLVEIEGYCNGNVVDSIYFAIDDYVYIKEVESIILSSDVLNFANTDTQTLTATVTPSSQQENLTWESSDSNVATVAGGVVTPIGNGTCTITAKCGSITATCTVTVDIAESELYYSINSILNGCTLSNTDTRVKDGATYVATITESENTTINTVTIKMGGVDITDTAYNSNSKTIGIDIVTGNIEIVIIVNKLATGITLNQSAITLSSIGATQQLTATLTPSGATGTVEWSSDNDSVATVVNGLVTVTATTSGSCTITATCNGHSATCTVTVNIKTKTVVYSLDSVTANLTSSAKEIAIGSSRNLTLPTQLQKGIRYYLKAESFKYEDGTDVDSPTEKVYVFCAGGYLGSTQVSSQIFKTAYCNVTTEVELLDVYGNPITDDNNIDTLKDFIIKISSSSTKTLPVTVTLSGLEIYTYGETI